MTILTKSRNVHRMITFYRVYITSRRTSTNQYMVQGNCITYKLKDTLIKHSRNIFDFHMTYSYLPPPIDCFDHRLDAVIVNKACYMPSKVDIDTNDYGLKDPKVN